jgi:hypothetical protein
MMFYEICNMLSVLFLQRHSLIELNPKSEVE